MGTNPSQTPEPQPPAHQKPIEVVLVRIGSNFTVKSIRNTTFWIPGDNVTRETASIACATPGWDVTIVDNDIISSIVGGTIGAITGRL